mmetsp:Transcript_8300/g.17935  ORF Transcript_8300/g.17935 Transcript_8300/m.17935 type:complete len:184 (+) Transcript_8300:157-708(+)
MCCQRTRHHIDMLPIFHSHITPDCVPHSYSSDDEATGDDATSPSHVHPPLGGRPVPVAHVLTRRRTLPHLGSSLFVLPISHPHSFIASTNIASDEYRTTPTNTNNFRILLIEVELLIEVVLRANAWTNSTPRFSLKWVVETRDTPPANLLLYDATRRRISHAHDSTTTIRMPSIPARAVASRK